MPRLPSNKPGEVSEETAVSAILEALIANARAATSAASARSRDGQTGPAAAAFASAVRDLADALRTLEQPAAADVPQHQPPPRTPLSQKVRAMAEKSLES